MGVELLSESQVAQLGRRPLTYEPVGDPAPRPLTGYAYFSRTRRLPAGRTFEARVEALMGWQVHVRSGLRVAASSLRAGVGEVVLMRFGIGAASLQIPCRVVTVFDEADQRGFTYGTLLGHPESGEETFLVGRNPDGSVDFTVSAFSRPVSATARLGGPLTRQVQRLMTGRYLRALD